MTYEEAKKAAKEGGKVSRRSWAGKKFLCYGVVQANWPSREEDILANDWEMFENEEVCEACRIQFPTKETK